MRVVEEDNNNSQNPAASSSTTYVNNSKQQQNSVNVFQRSSVTIEEVDNSPLHDLTAFDVDCDGTSFSGIHVVSHLDDRAPFSSAYTPAAAVFHMDDMDSDHDWTVELFDIMCMDLTTTFQSTTFQPSICQQLEPYFDHDFDCDLNVYSVRAFHFAGDPVDIILDSGADGSVLPMSYAHVGTSVLSQ